VNKRTPGQQRLLLKPLRWSVGRVVHAGEARGCGEAAGRRLGLSLQPCSGPLAELSAELSAPCAGKVGADSLPAAGALSLGVAMLIMLPSFAVCSGDITTESYM